MRSLSAKPLSLARLKAYIALMQYRRLGNSGLRLSQFSFGSWVTFKNQVEVRDAKNLFAAAYERGVNFFDNAEVYADGESEKIMGQAISELGWGRDTYCVSSKVFWGGDKPTQSGLSRKHVTDACHAALKRLRVDYLDLYFCHRPDIHTPVEETVRTMSDLVRQGKILYWGTSEWSAQQLTEAYEFARADHQIPPTMEQPEYNLFNRTKLEAEYLPLFRKYGMGTTIWSPLASGLLTGKYSAGIPGDARVNLPGYEWLKERFQSPEGQAKIRKTEELGKLASQLEMKTSQLALAWCASNPNVSTVILGASKLEQLTENLATIDLMSKLTDGVKAEIEKIVANRPEQPRDLTE